MNPIFQIFFKGDLLLYYHSFEFWFFLSFLLERFAVSTKLALSTDLYVVCPQAYKICALQDMIVLLNLKFGQLFTIWLLNNIPPLRFVTLLQVAGITRVFLMQTQKKMCVVAGTNLRSPSIITL